jgi:hypothetical protein
LKTFLFLFGIYAMSFMYSCSANDPQGYGEEDFCNCGLIVTDSVHESTHSYLFIVENECSGNEKTFIVDALVHSAYYEGERICINDQQPW